MLESGHLLVNYKLSRDFRKSLVVVFALDGRLPTILLLYILFSSIEKRKSNKGFGEEDYCRQEKGGWTEEGTLKGFVRRTIIILFEGKR
jgi:hypothetical protein